MAFHHCLNMAIFFILSILFTISHATTFDIQNSCSYPIWAAAVPGGGKRLDHGQTWTLNISNATSPGRIWARTNCSFAASGKGHCQTGDCDGLLECKSFGSPPNTLSEYALNQFNNQDIYDISLVDGFNVPLEFVPISNSCSAVKCAADINGQCPAALRAPGGCNNPCTVFKTNEYCCFNGSCDETEYSRFFRTECPEAYSSPQDDHASTTVCPGGTNYRVVFCP